MVKVAAFASLLAVSTSTVAAHPGVGEEHIKHEMALRNVAHAHASRALSNCQNSAEARALQQRSAVRRANKAVELRQARGLSSKPFASRDLNPNKKRDMTELLQYVAISHNQTAAVDYTLDTPETTIFGSNNTCALVPETTIGPYYVTGEFIRSNITEGQAGVPLHMEMQFVDINTCLPVSQLAADVWHCNSTGTYSGVEAEDTLDETFLRGVQISDEDGVAAFDSLFPGHYADRVTHFHLVAQANVTTLPNGTYIGGTTKHIGQLYFDDALVKEVETTYPYTTNTVAYTTPTEDGWMLEEATTDYDPFVDYVQLTDDISDGVLAWITVGINSTADHSDLYEPASHYYAGGGVSIENAGEGTGPSNPCAVGPTEPTCTITSTDETLPAKLKY